MLFRSNDTATTEIYTLSAHALAGGRDLSAIDNVQFTIYKEGRHELAIQGRTVELQLRRVRERQVDGVERCEEPRRAETPPLGEEGRPDFLLSHRRRKTDRRHRQSARR